jgi:pimeloyl-ACP methyl ester carboxylesterase
MMVACGGDKAGSSAKDDTLSYAPGTDLAVQLAGSSTEGALRVQQLEYTSVDGTQVPALFAVPTGKPPLGCLIFVPGFGSTKEAVPELRQGLARLRLATFSIDARNVGARGGPEQAAAAIRTPEGIRKMLLDTVADLRVGLDWLEQQPECHSNIAVLGTSFGATVATHLAAQDRRVKAAVLTSVGATYKQTILMRPLVAQTVPDLPNYVPGAEDPAVLAHAVEVLGPYDLERCIGRIAPRPVMLVEGRHDPIVSPADALQLAAAARPPKTVLYFDGGHDPFDDQEVSLETTKFLVKSLHLPGPTL